MKNWSKCTIFAVLGFKMDEIGKKADFTSILDFSELKVVTIFDGLKMAGTSCEY